MKVSEHITYGGVASIALTPFFGFQTIFFFIGSLAIDIDHYIDFLYYNRFRDWSFIRMFKFHGHMAKQVDKTSFLALEAYHTIEFLFAFLMIALFFHSTELLLLFWGMIFHLSLDLVRLKQKNILHARALSFFEYWVRSKKMMAQKGEHPEKIFWKAYEAIS